MPSRDEPLDIERSSTFSEYPEPSKFTPQEPEGAHRRHSPSAALDATVPLWPANNVGRPFYDQDYRPNRPDESSMRSADESPSDVITPKKKSSASTSGCLGRIYPAGLCKSVKETMSISFGLVMTQMCIQGVQPIATMFAGHLGTLELDAVGLANTIINISGTSIAIGTSTACITVFSQTYGAKNYPYLGILLQKSIFIMLFTLMPCYALHLNMEQILLHLGQDAKVAKLAAQYLILFMPGNFFSFMYILLRCYAQTQNVVYPLAVLCVLSTLAGTLSQYILLYVYDYGVVGSAISQDITYFLMFATTAIYMKLSGRFDRTWNGWDKRCLCDWGSFSRLAVHGLLMMCFEWWAFEVTVILAGILGKTSLGAQTVIFNLDALPLSIAVGLGLATSVKVGQSLGAGDPVAGKTFARVGLTIASSVSAVMMVIYATLRYQLPKIFTSDTAVIELTAEILLIAVIYNFFDYQAAVYRGILRGCGKQALGMKVVFLAYYVIALPMIYPLMFKYEYGVCGAWYALTIALVFGDSVYFVYINFFMDWELLSSTARERAGIKSDQEDIGEDSCEKTPLLKSGGEKLHSLSLDNRLPSACKGDRPELEQLLCKTTTNSTSSGTDDDVRVEGVVMQTVREQPITTWVIVNRLLICGFFASLVAVGYALSRLYPVVSLPIANQPEANGTLFNRTTV